MVSLVRTVLHLPMFVSRIRAKFDSLITDKRVHRLDYTLDSVSEDLLSS